MHDADHHLSLRPILFRDRLLSWICAANIDKDLAAGAPIESRKLRAVRATLLVTPAHRNRLATAWGAVLRQAHLGSVQAPSMPSSRVPLQRNEIRDAAVEIELLAAVLRSPRPVSARGAAMARILLVDGGGPLYCSVRHPGNHRSLADSVADAARELDSLCL